MRWILYFGLCLSFNLAQAFEGWKGFSAPDIMASGFIHQFQQLPLEGSMQIGPKAWSGHYWPSQEGGINIRWNSPKPEGFKYKSPSLMQLKQMSEKEIAQLSPTEKYDILKGDYEYALKELAATATSKTAPDWAGICHGWAPAALHHAEPTPKVLTNKDGIRIPFASSDIKALMSYYYAFHHETESTHQVGLRCFFGRWMGGARACDEDLNAGAFHIVMTNMLGLRQEGFVADVDRYREVWNQPVVAYRSKVLAHGLKPHKEAAEGTTQELRILTEFTYVNEVEKVTWDVVHGTKNQILTTREFVYRIELNSRNEIIGGAWESDDRPDFLWNREKAKKFVGILNRLSDLLND
jgi:hypothetical protein